MELYDSMNEKIADIIAIDGTPSSLYASAYIKDLRAENARLKSEKQLAEAQLKELLSALYQRTDNEDKSFTIYRTDIVELAEDYGIKEEELK